MGGSQKFFQHCNLHKIWSRTICNMHMYDSYMSHNLKIFKKDAWLITHDRDKNFEKTHHHKIVWVIKFHFIEKNWPRQVSSATWRALTIFVQNFPKITAPTHLRGRVWFFVYKLYFSSTFKYLFWTNFFSFGQKFIWVLLLIRRFIEYRRQYIAK